MWFCVKGINLFAKKLKMPLHFIPILVIIIKSANGGVAKWLNAAVCKTALSEFGGSNPPSSIIGISYNGSTSVSKTVDVGSIPTIPVYLHGGIGEGVNTPVCGSGIHGFESHIPP